MTWIEGLSLFFLFIGSFFMLLAGIGLLRMPDLFLRMSAATKASTLGVGFILLAAAIYFDELGVTSRALATIVFVLLTAPIAAHRIARAGYFAGVRLWEGTLHDDLRGRYDQETHLLSGK
ncbi:MAG: monovalent cation/H(+) antiporter subunit G [Anaerolineales bacterium]|nr:monovalent cation/H(+) antiporter subunit G [Anaerolineales bacterium]